MVCGVALNQTFRVNNFFPANASPPTFSKVTGESSKVPALCNPWIYIYIDFGHHIDFYWFVQLHSFVTNFCFEQQGHFWWFLSIVLQFFLSQNLYFWTTGTFLGENVQVSFAAGWRLGFRGCFAFGRIVRTHIVRTQIVRTQLLEELNKDENLNQLFLDVVRLN